MQVLVEIVIALVCSKFLQVKVTLFNEIVSSRIFNHVPHASFL